MMRRRWVLGAALRAAVSKQKHTELSPVCLLTGGEAAAENSPPA